MSNGELPPHEANVSEVSSQLQDGIQSCRSVVANYRSLLSGAEHAFSSNDNDPKQDQNLSGIEER